MRRRDIAPTSDARLNRERATAVRREERIFRDVAHDYLDFVRQGISAPDCLASCA